MVYLQFNIDQEGGLIQGHIVQTDTTATFRHRDPSKGVQRFSFIYLNDVCQVNQEKVVVEKLRRDQDLLYFVESYRLKMAVFVKYYEDSGYLLLTSPSSSKRWKKQLNEVYYNYSCTGKDANDKAFFRQLGGGGGREREREGQIQVGICYHQRVFPTVPNMHWVFSTVANTHH